MDNCFFDDEEDKTFAFKMIENMQQPNENDPILVREQNSSPYDNNDIEQKLAHNISQRIKKEDRFTGKLGDDIEE